MAPPLWFLPVVVALLTQVTTPAVVHGAVPRGDCPDKCGNVTIPYPFGIGKECSLPGQDHFAVECDEKSQRPFLGRGIEILGITLETGEMLVTNPMTEACHVQNGTQKTKVHYQSTKARYLVSAASNEFTAIGCNVTARMTGKLRGGDSMITGCITYCSSIEEAAEDGEPCTGLGCCKASIATGINEVDVRWSFNKTDNDIPVWQYNPCMYAFVAKKGW